MMKNTPGRSAAAPMIFLALAARLFLGMGADFPVAHNASWLCPIVGFGIYLPFGLAVKRLDGLGNDSGWGNLTACAPRAVLHITEAIFATALLFDCAVSMRIMANSASALALGEFPVFVLLLPLALMVFVSVFYGADAAGNSARIWLRMLPFFITIMIVVQWKAYELSWLTPFLGSGAGNILSGGIYCAGSMALLTLPWLVSVPDRNKNGHLRYVLLAAIAASGLLALLQMLTPPMIGVDLTRTARTLDILSNGRVALGIQIVMIALWYGGLMHVIAVEAVTAACFVNRILPKAPQWALAAGEAFICFIAAVTTFATAIECVVAFRLMYAAVGGMLTGAMLFGLKGREERKCEG